MATGSSRTGRVRLTPLHAAFGLLVIGALTGGCSEQGSAERLSKDSPLFLGVSQSAVTIENRAGLPLTDVTIVIVPYGLPMEFSRSFSRLDNGNKREIPLFEFMSRDSTPFNLRLQKPKFVRVRAKDVAGKSYEIEIPWS